jgi:diguanylate cyclase (GGDEF)-like protein
MPLLADTAVWIAVAAAIGAALLALGLSAALAVYLTRAREAPRDDLGVVRDAVSRTEAMVTELSGALEDAREESRRSRLQAEISSSLDLDAVLQRALEAAKELKGVDAAMISLLDENEPLVATAGMSAEEAARQPTIGPPDAGTRAVRIDYRYAAAQEESADTPLIRGGVAVPLHGAEDEAAGTLAVFWRGSERAPSEAEIARLEELAESCGPAIRNAQRFREARTLADLDALTSLHNRRYFHETLAREVARADRYDRRLALVVLDIDDFKAINDRVGHLAGDSVLAAAAERLSSVVRGADVACRVGGDEFAVILPEAGLADAERLYHRIRQAIGSRPIGPADRVQVSAGIAELGPRDDAVSFFQRADEALYRAKGAGKGQMRPADDTGASGS